MQHTLSATARPVRAPAGRWVVLSLLTLGVLIAFVDRTSISSSMADRGFNRHFGLTNVDRGWVGSAFFWTYGIAQVFMGWVVDRYGVKTPYAICFFIWSLAIAATGAVSSFEALIAMRFLVGAAEAVVIPASYRWIRNNFDDTQNGTTTGILTMGNKFGPALGAPVAAWLIVHYSWQMMFYVTGALSLLWLVPWLLVVRNDMPRDRAAQARAQRDQGGTVTLRNLLASPVLWGGMILNFCYGYFTFFCMAWMPAYLVESRGLSLQRSAIFTFFSFAGIAIMGLAAGYAADRIIARGHDAILVRKIFITIGFVGGCTILLGVDAHSLAAALFWNVASLTLLGFTTANTIALCRLQLMPKPAIGLATGIQQLATSFAGGASASLSGWLLQVGGSYRYPMMAILVFLVIGAATTWILLRPEYAPKVTPAPLPG